MKIFCMSDIHGCLAEFEEALALVTERLREPGTMLLLLGDYVHGGADNRAVLDRIISLQDRYGSEKVVALMGNHEEFVINYESDIDNLYRKDDNEDDDRYIKWMEDLPRLYTAGNTIFVHAGIDEEAGDLWEWEEDLFTNKYPAQTGKINGLDKKIVAGHVGTAEISGDPRFHDIYFDGQSHYYIDGTVLDSGVIPVLMVDTETDKYYRVTETGIWPVLPYNEEY